MLCATLSTWAFVSWGPKGRKGAEGVTFPFLVILGPQTCTLFWSHWLAAETVAGVSLLPTFQLSLKPCGSPDSTHMASSMSWSPVSLYALSVAQSVSEVKLGSFDFRTTDHSPRASVGVAAFHWWFQRDKRGLHRSQPMSSSFLKGLYLFTRVLASCHLSGSPPCLSCIPFTLVSSSLASSLFRSKASNSSLCFQQNGFPSSPC